MAELGQAKAYSHGTHRTVAPAETLARAQRVMNKMGITRLANITGLDVIGIPVVNAFRPNARSLAVSQGKGLDLTSAKVSALMESIELYHAEHIRQPLLLATTHELERGASVVSVERLPQLSLNGFHKNRQLLWLAGHDLGSDEEKLVPYELVHTNYTLPLPTGSGCFVMSSNGLASGNTRSEATLHALCELIERDATTLWRVDSRERQDARRLDLATIADEACCALLERYRAAGVAVGVWEITSDIGVPVYVCAILDDTRDRARLLYPTYGMGCHPAREVALARALTEAAQSRLTLIAGARDDTGRDKYELAQTDTAWRELRNRLDAPGVRRWLDTPSSSASTIDEDLRMVLESLRARELSEVVVVDLTLPEFEIPVVRVVVPGLEAPFEASGCALGSRARRVLQHAEEWAS